MKKLLSLAAILPIASIFVLNTTNNAQAAAFKNGDTTNGNGGNVIIGVATSLADPAQLFFGTQGITTPPAAITLGKAGNVKSFADIGGTANGFIPADSALPNNAGNGFFPFDDTTVKIKSYITGTPGLITNFVTVAPSVATSGLGLTVDIESTFFETNFTNGFLTAKAKAKVKRSDDPTVYNGIFSISAQNIDPSTLGPNVGTGSVDLVSNSTSYSWSLEIAAVPEPSGVAGLLALGVLGGGVVLKRKLKA